MMQSLQIADESSMLALGGLLARVSSAGCVIYLRGSLGSGKTTLTRGFLRELGYQQAVKSPTYTLVESYQLAHKTIYHFDLYRIIDAEELEYMGIRDYFSCQAIVLIEWPERAEALLPVADIDCHIFIHNESREVQLSFHGQKQQDLLTQFEQLRSEYL